MQHAKAAVAFCTDRRVLLLKSQLVLRGKSAPGATWRQSQILQPVSDSGILLVLTIRNPVCRVLLSKPRLVLMDESTSALDTGNEASLYAALGAAGITYISVGHRPSLVCTASP